MKKLQYLLEYGFLVGLLVFVRLIPKPILSKLSQVLGFFLYLAKVRRKVIDINLSIAFGTSLEPSRLDEIRKKTYYNAAAIFFEFLCMNHIKPQNLSRYIDIEGQEHFERALDQNRGMIVAGNHFGHWELATAAISYFCQPLHIFTGMQKNIRVDQAMNKIRERFGTVTISKSKTAPFEMLKALKANKPLGMAGDLNVPHDNLFVDFFGKKAVVGQGLATFTLKREAPLLFIWSVRLAPFKYKAFVKPIDYTLTGDAQTDQQTVAQLISDELEDKIRENPDQYFWFNRRWKTRPPEETDGNVY